MLESWSKAQKTWVLA